MRSTAFHDVMSPQAESILWSFSFSFGEAPTSLQSLVSAVSQTDLRRNVQFNPNVLGNISVFLRVGSFLSKLNQVQKLQNKTTFLNLDYCPLTFWSCKKWTCRSSASFAEKTFVILLKNVTNCCLICSQTFFFVQLNINHKTLISVCSFQRQWAQRKQCFRHSSVTCG